MVTFQNENTPRYIGYVCCKCGATASTFVWRNRGWHCLLCSPDVFQHSVQWTVEQAPRKNRYSSSHVGGRHNHR